MDKLKEQMEKEIKRVTNKYKSAVFVLNGGTYTEAIKLFGFKCPSKTLRAMCKKANTGAYEILKNQQKNAVTYISRCDGEIYTYFKDVTIKDLRKYKNLFVGDSKS